MAKQSEITIAGGCFWCIEAVFNRVKGVESAISGYANGNTEKPTYKDVCTGKSGFAEGVKITYNPDIVSLSELLEIFFAVHDPTTLNRQGADTGTQYRSGIYYTDEAQQEICEEAIKQAQKKHSKKIVTELCPLKNWYEAEEYHQRYFETNPHQGYCLAVVAPKVQKLFDKFPQKVLN